MTRFLYLVSSLLIFVLNGAALWHILIRDPAPSRLAVAALVVNAVIWPLALPITYRIGQATGRLHDIKVRAARKARLAGRTR